VCRNMMDPFRQKDFIKKKEESNISLECFKFYLDALFFNITIIASLMVNLNLRSYIIFWWTSQCHVGMKIFILYGVSLIVICIRGARPCKTSSNTGSWFNTLMLLSESVTPKNACQIHKSCEAMSIIVGLR